MIYCIWGGRFASSEAAWSAIIPSPSLVVGDFTTHGPFTAYPVAEAVWRAASSRSIDICAHRLLLATLPAEDHAVWAHDLLVTYLNGRGLRATVGHSGGALHVRVPDSTAPSSVPSVVAGLPVTVTRAALAI